VVNFLENNKNRPLAFVPMCGDPIHVGHINILNEASKYGSVVVGLMTDEAMISYKRKPITSYKNRAAVVEHLKMVDYVYPLDGIDYAKVANKFKLDFFLHGDDWLENIQKKSRDNLINAMKGWNGEVIDVKYTEGISSTIYNN
tara:strand:- start:195 stop:623 length:429 start_codon:yes stop_codon:yes gene_type:complete